jgi:hypothetical protein
MIKLIKRSSNIIGIDGAIAFTLLSRIIQAGGGIVSLIFIAKCLTKVEQGYYYTFGSILAIQIFFELGLSNIITQFVAHENADLIFGNNNDKKYTIYSQDKTYCVDTFRVYGGQLNFDEGDKSIIVKGNYIIEINVISIIGILYLNYSNFSSRLISLSIRYRDA